MNHVDLSRWQMRALIIGAIAALLSIIGAFINHAQFFQSYLFAWLFWLGLSLGALVVVMMQNLTGGWWGLAVRNLCFAAIMTLPLLVLLFVPVLFGLHDIYAWSNGIALGVHKRAYLNVPFFISRSVFYFAVLLVFAFALRRSVREYPIALSAGGLICYVLCMNFASTDWVMSLDPEWYSTVCVIVFMAGQFLAALSLTTALLCALMRLPIANRQFPIDAQSERDSPIRNWQLVIGNVPTKAFHDLGNMLLAFVIFWIYVAFSQLLIIWSGNLPKEISWYLPRSRGGWQWLALVVMVGEFLLPFFLLLSREAKRTPRRLAQICVCILVINVLNTFWLIAPTFHARLFVHWLDIAELIAIGGFWFAVFFYLLKQRPLIAPELLEVKRHG